MRDYSGYRKCKIKTIKVLSSYNNALCYSSKIVSEYDQEISRFYNN